MRLLWLIAAYALLGVRSPAAGAAAASAAGPTVRDIVEFTRIVQPEGKDPAEIRRQISPDGTRAFIVVRRANVATDTNRYEILLLSLQRDALGSGNPSPPETVFSFDADKDPYDGDQAVQRVRWLDENTLVFTGRIGAVVNQAYRFDLRSRVLTPLTREDAPVVSFDVSKDGRRMVYAVQVPNPPMAEGARSIVIGNQSFWAVKWGQLRLQSQLRKYRFYVSDIGTSAKPRPLGVPFFEANFAKPQVSIAPDGRWALLPRYEPERTLAWSHDYPLLAEVVTRYAPALQADPLRYYSGALVKTARRMTAWRLDDGREQTIVDAPDDALPGWFQGRADRLWQGRGESVILAGTHLPIARGRDASAASHVVEYWPDSGRWEVVARMVGRVQAAEAMPDGFVVVDDGRRRRFQRRDTGGWREVADAGRDGDAAGTAWSLRLHQSLNEPPDVVADGPAGQTVRLTRLNPQFTVATWGVMKPYAWRDAKGREWSGGLLGPKETTPRGRRPLVIQTYFFDTEAFYLDGPNFNFGFTSAYPGRAFVGEDILVLAMGLRPTDGMDPRTDSQTKLTQFYEGVRGAVDALVKDGLVDPDRVGIIGFSTTGESTLNLVTFSDLAIRAATLADGDTNTLFQLSVAYGVEAWRQMEEMNRGLPFGPTRDEWLRNDPSLNTDCVRAALRIESYGVPVYGNYDIYALLRRQYKPAEMVLIPGGAHSLAMPSERMISLQGNVDWYRFWLKGVERTVPTLAAETTDSLKTQYNAWRQMEMMKAQVDATPRCTREPSRG
jgi:dipeptidyl aminopeptidase/acylaminoacyl peptidase